MKTLSIEDADRIVQVSDSGISPSDVQFFESNIHTFIANVKTLSECLGYDSVGEMLADLIPE